MTDHRLLFISGLHRSGTTQLASTLASHPDVSGMVGTGAPHDEGQHLQTVYPTARAHGGPGRFAFDPAAHLTEASPLATPASAAELFAQWTPHWDLGARVLVEKSPPNLVRMRFLQALFPQARFVVVVRHPAVTAMATRKLATTRTMRRTFRTASLALAARHWFAAHDLLLEDLPHLHRVHALRWEDLCADPRGQLGAIAAFAGVDDRFDLPSLDPRVDDSYAAQWQELTTVAPSRSTRELRDVLDEHADAAARFGYPVDRLGTDGPLAL